MATVTQPRRIEPSVRNPGIPLDLGWIGEVRTNRRAVERRAAALPPRRPVKQSYRAAWLVRAIQCLDLTTLGGDDTPGSVRRLCAKAKSPLRADLVEGLGLDPAEVRVAAVCVYPNLVPVAVESLRGSGVRVASVAAGFPSGQMPLRTRLGEIEEVVRMGADEVDVVITRSHVLRVDWQALYDEVRAFREAAGTALLKVIVACGELGTLRQVAQATSVAMMAGADFVKTSTGKEAVNATPEFGIVMARAVREYAERTGFRVGLKPAGGIRTTGQALDWLVLVKEELGDPWLDPGLFRIGASALLADIERELEQYRHLIP